MSRRILPDVIVGNEFVVPVRSARPALATSVATPQPVMAAPTPAPALDGLTLDFETVPVNRRSLGLRLLEILHQQTVIVFALMSLVIGMLAIEVAGNYLSARIAVVTAPNSLSIPAQPKHGPNMIVANADLTATMQRVTAQPINLVVDQKVTPVSPEIINSWLKVVTDKQKGISYINVNEGAIHKSMADAVAPFVEAPVNQVVATREDGSSQVIAAGKNGTQIGDTAPLTKQVADQLLRAPGFELKVPFQTLAFATVSPDSFDKLIEVNVTTKQMYLYEKGKLYKQYPISAGAPETPTLIGQYKIFSKLPVQDMRGFNADGSRYFQPHVRWVMYWAPGGYAVHGNYWRPLSWFGNRNSSHGCVSLPDTQAKEVYDWAPLGTTVITHH